MLHLFLIALCLTSNALSADFDDYKAKDTNHVPDLLLGISTEAKNFDNRERMRRIQIATYSEFSEYVDWRFFIAVPEENTTALLEAIHAENKTHGDIILLDIPDNYITARRDKPFVFFQYVMQNMAHYKYIGKMDNDTFMDIRGFFEHYFTPEIRNDNRTMISYFYPCGENYERLFPQGAFYAFSWDIVQDILELWGNPNIERYSVHEDIMMSWYLDDANITYKRVSIKEEHNFDYGFWKHGTLWSVYSTQMKNVVRVHGLKDVELYNTVSRFFIARETGNEVITDLVAAECELWRRWRIFVYIITSLLGFLTYIGYKFVLRRGDEQVENKSD